MARVGQVMGALYLFFLLPVLPILLVYVGLHRVVTLLAGSQGADRGYEPALG